MSIALKEMRVDPGNSMVFRLPSGNAVHYKISVSDDSFTVKKPEYSNSNLAKKRRNKTASSSAIPSTINEQLSTE
jgi:hypothetical protein